MFLVGGRLRPYICVVAGQYRQSSFNMATEVKQDVLATAASAAPGSTPVVSTSPSGPTSSVRVTAGFTTAPEVGTTGGGSSSKPNHYLSSQQHQQPTAAASQTQQNQGLSHTSSKTTSQSGVGSGSPTATSINNPQPTSTNVGAGAGKVLQNHFCSNKSIVTFLNSCLFADNVVCKCVGLVLF